MIPSLQRVTTEYVETEDRIRLNGIAGECTLSIWLSKRLTDRLVVNISQLLEQQHITQEKRVKNDLLSFSQQAAKQASQRSAEQPVPPPASPQPETSWLTMTIQLAAGPDFLKLTFVGESDEQKAELKMGIGHLRQWANILFFAYKKGEWATDAWPEWMQDNLSTDTTSATLNKKVH